MIVHPYIRPGNMVVYSPEGRDDVQISVRIDAVDQLVGVWIECSDGARGLVDASRLSPMPEARMKPVASIRQIANEFEANGGDVSRLSELMRKNGVGLA